MWEAYGLKNKDFLWAATAFQGGIAGEQQAPCGAISGATIALGLRHRVATDDKEKVKKARDTACEEAAELVRSFEEKFGAITCIELLGVDFKDEGAMKRAIESRLFEQKCDNQVLYVIEKLYEFEKRRT
jgi:C_GCAxxG_C_C family probable redox protein